MVAIDISGIVNLMPIWSFLLIFAVVYALVAKTKVLGENRFVQLLVSFAVAIIFLVSAQATEYVRFITPWVAIFIVCLVFAVLLIGVFLKTESLEKVFGTPFGWFILVLLLIFFVLSGIYVFGPSISKIALKPQAWGILLLGIIVVFVSWLLTREK